MFKILRDGVSVLGLSKMSVLKRAAEVVIRLSSGEINMVHKSPGVRPTS